MGIRIIDADDVVHELEASGGAAVSPIVARFGDAVLAPDGGIDRSALAKLVFGESPSSATCPHSAARKDLESILFPLVRQRLNDFLSARQPTIDSRQPPSDAQFSMAIIPLLFESHWDKDYDIIITLASAHEAQIRRMAETRGQSREEAEARIAAQMPVAEKAARADYVVRNDSTPQALYSEAVRLVEWLKSKTKG